MHVITLSGDKETADYGIKLVLNRLSNSGGTLSDEFESIIESGDYYIAVGRSSSNLSGLTGGTNTQGDSDFVIAKFNASDLSLVNINNIGGTVPDYFKSVIESDSYYIAVGYSRSNLSGFTGGSNTTGWEDFVIARFNKSDLSLDRLNNLGSANVDNFYSVIESDSYYIAVGQSDADLSALTGGANTTGSYDFVIAKFNKSDLSLARIANLGGLSSDSLASVIESDNYYIATGSSMSDLSGLTGGSSNQGSTDFVIARFNKSDLSLDRINSLGGTSADGIGSVIESAGYYIAVGVSVSDLSGFTGGNTNKGAGDFVIAKFNKSDLSMIKVNNFGKNLADFFNFVIESGNYYIASGYSSSDLSGFTGGSTNQGNFDFLIAKLNKSDLSLVDINNLGGSTRDYIYSIIESKNHYIAVGSSESDLSGLTGGSSTQGSSDFTIMKFGE